MIFVIYLQVSGAVFTDWERFSTPAKIAGERICEGTNVQNLSYVYDSVTLFQS